MVGQHTSFSAFKSPFMPVLPHVDVVEALLECREHTKATIQKIRRPMLGCLLGLSSNRFNL